MKSSEFASILARKTHDLRIACLERLSKEPFQDLYLELKKIHNQTEEEFADSLAQTLTFILFVSKLRGDLCLANPVLRNLYEIASSDVELLRPMIAFVSEAEVTFEKEDPVIHFYEEFLGAYNKKLKNKRGVFFTPRPVVLYIVRSVHELLQREFGLEDGLASTDTWGDLSKRVGGIKIPEGAKESDPFVCILDPATGTGIRAQIPSS
jgi:hypothetical protein